MPKISVIVPVYKAEKYIYRCIDSILAQTFDNFELILVDDGSPDNCGVICDEYAARDSRIRVIHQENQGQASARNHGVAMAEGEWVCFVDSDDLIHPQMLEHLYDITKCTGAEIIACDNVYGDSIPVDFFKEKEDRISVKKTDEQGLMTIYNEWRGCYWLVWGKLIRKRIIQKIPMTAGRIYEDNAVVCQWLCEAGIAAYTETKYYFYQENLTGTTQSAFSLKHLDWLWALKEQIVFYKGIGYRCLEKKITARFLMEAANDMERCVKELNNYEAARGIRRDMKRIMRGKKLSTLPLSERDRYWVRRKMHPCEDYLWDMLLKCVRYIRWLKNNL